ncbi:sporulation integral membrane protein YtvI [Aquisalibacillus elongatus]|uniref:Sporulation integral membrane protein YtvI n=1 Tax=Aquisalibacillus elongatus TaxID=485577 RepID=A0A3N5BH83_9BACI|nr:sporulation integral membrane protein YtvI [Aquisalibacillus elongatus]RPF56109.1 sporulation integral membrane protein YtvI [Aquisalibacillus elongatus]
MFKNITKRQWTIALYILLLILFFYFILPISVPLLLAFITALFVNPLVRLCTRRFRVSRKIAVTIIFLLFILILATIGTFTTTKVVGQVIKITENIPEYIQDVETELSDLQTQIDAFTEEWPREVVTSIESQVTSTLSDYGTRLQDYNYVESITQVFMKVPNFLIGLLVYLIALFLFMLELPNLRNKFYNMMTEETQEKFKFMNARMSYVLLGFLKAQFLVSVIIFTVSLLGLLLFVPEVAFIMSLIIWLVDLIPIIGSIIVLGPWALYMFFTGDLLLGTQLAVLAVILLTIRRTIEPKVMGHHIGLSPLPTLISMFLGLQLIGFLGFFLGPLVVILFNSAKEAGIIKWNLKI